MEALKISWGGFKYFPACPIYFFQHVSRSILHPKGKLHPLSRFLPPKQIMHLCMKNKNVYEIFKGKVEEPQL